MHSFQIVRKFSLQTQLFPIDGKRKGADPSAISSKTRPVGEGMKQHKEICTDTVLHCFNGSFSISDSHFNVILIITVTWKANIFLPNQDITGHLMNWRFICSCFMHFLNKFSLENTTRCIGVHKQWIGLSKIGQIWFFLYLFWLQILSIFWTDVLNSIIILSILFL